MQTITQLTEKFGQEKSISFYEKDQHIIIKVANTLATFEVTTYGAHILSYIPAGKEDLLYMSPISGFEKGTPIRGGVPICFPWFGPNGTDKSLPMHGFARLTDWTLTDAKEESTGKVTLVLTLTSTPETKAMWPFDFEATMIIVVGKTMKAELTIKNTGTDSFCYSSALHTYFSVGDISKVTIDGLQDKAYYWGFDAEKLTQSEELLAITKEENRRYLGTEEACLIADKSLGRSIIADKTGSKVTVVWNPFEEACKGMGDIPDADYKKFICIEAANAYDNIVELHSNHTHTTGILLGLI